ncbi:MAG: ribosome biogenesis GTPase Der [Bacteroidales bacterium]|jgi:GTP-binding protein|nr:ribosome biogenesis GTPase Der [Bacteroidales bacterium]MDD2824866.1 ribosome biogenesis GTPase Der [Bacteroidales bacterium]MDD3099905.1 ribosome biogenesis GTPase Der [Bacteroidales bacterium]MDD3638589.1 ribosome biogenesis GTPase Der [Bacteroidales bacterium]MDD3943284.1 ribosome biogenesis GTPase Der [Bacteroidales bacterium]
MSIVAIVGRPNVGKSTLFNRLVGKRQAIVDQTAGVTRDRHYGKTDWNGREFSIIDTGGYAENSDDVFEEQIRRQVHLAIEEADAVIFVVDVQTGITDYDQGIARILRKSDKPVIVAVNKVDHGGRIFDSYEFNALGLGEPVSIAAVNGSGTGDLLDKVLEVLPDMPQTDQEREIPHIAVVGRPNVGKSSLTNAFLGEERNIVTPVAGTTRDAIATRYNKFGYEFMLVDTAGLRKKTKTREDLEFYSSMRAIRAIEFSDVCILMLDATLGVEAQDMSIFQLILRNKKGCVIVVNKWDLVEKETNTLREYEKNIRARIAPFTDVPVIFTSVIKKQRILNVLEAAAKVFGNRTRRIPTSRLNEVLLPQIEAYPPPAIKGKFVKIKYITQLPTPCPSFAFFCNLPQYIREDYKRFLENKLRAHFDFHGTPVQIYMRQK